MSELKLSFWNVLTFEKRQFVYRINRISVNHYFIKQHTYATCRTIRAIMCFFKKRPSLKKGRQDQQRGLLLVSAQREDVDWKADKPSKVLPSTSRTMWGSNYVLLPAGRQRGAKAGATMEFQAREHIMKTRKSAASSEKKLWGSSYVLPPVLGRPVDCQVRASHGSRSSRKNFASLFAF